MSKVSTDARAMIHSQTIKTSSTSSSEHSHGIAKCRCSRIHRHAPPITDRKLVNGARQLVHGPRGLVTRLDQVLRQIGSQIGTTVRRVIFLVLLLRQQVACQRSGKAPDGCRQARHQAVLFLVRQIGRVHPGRTLSHNGARIVDNGTPVLSRLVPSLVTGVGFEDCRDNM